MICATQSAITRPKFQYAFDCTRQLEGLTLDDPVESGGFGIVYRCSLNGVPVAVKVLHKHCFTNIEEIAKEEYDVWHRLKHPNILQLEGICYVRPDSTVPSFVTRWQKNGNIKNYAKTNKHADFLSLIEDIAQGIAYLHDNDIIHGDLRAVNILVSDDLRALLTDFGISKHIEGDETSISEACRGNYRWMPPEYFADPNKFPAPGSKRSKSSDIWTYGVLIQEIFSGRSPFKSSSEAADFLGKRKHPTFHAAQHDSWNKFTDAIRYLWLRCCAFEPAQRPTITAVLEEIGDLRKQFGSSDAPPTTDIKPSASYPGNLIESDDDMVTISSKLSSIRLSSEPGPSERPSFDGMRVSRRSISASTQSTSDGINGSATARERAPPHPSVSPKSAQLSQARAPSVCPTVELNNYIARRGLGHRVTQNCFASGSIEQRTWNWVIKLDGEEIATGSGWKKSEAKKEASTKALAILCGKCAKSPSRYCADPGSIPQSDSFRMIGDDHTPTWIYTIHDSESGQVIEGRGSNKMDAKQNARLQITLQRVEGHR